jgi:DNA-binding transcriptional MerR regulator
MLTVGKLARRFNLSRSTLLYYNSIGLLRPSARSRSNYRLYSADDERRLATICTYREAGISLTEIKKLLDDGGDRQQEVLEERLEELNRDIAACREQQRVIVALLKHRHQLVPTSARTIDKDRWVEILSSAGLDDEAMRRWHVEFERLSPEGHQDFLESLGVSSEEVTRIREWSRES